jgi:hypothetical protein
MNGAIRLLLLYAFMAWTRTSLPLQYYILLCEICEVIILMRHVMFNNYTRDTALNSY